MKNYANDPEKEEKESKNEISHQDYGNNKKLAPSVCLKLLLPDSNWDDQSKDIDKSSTREFLSSEKRIKPLSIQQSKNFFENYLNTLPLQDHEKSGLLALYTWVIQDELSNKMAEDLYLGDLVLCYFSSFSKHNPDPKGCWKRWLLFREEFPLKNLEKTKIKQFFETGVFTVGYDKEKKPVWFVDLKYYDMEFGPEIITKCAIIWITSLLWDVSKNEYDFNALRKGISVYCDLSCWSLNVISWNIIKIVKAALINYPFQLIDMYMINTPSYIYLLRQIAVKVFIPHAIDKFRILDNSNQYIEKYGIKEQTPKWAGGLDETLGTEWLKKRGYL